MKDEQVLPGEGGRANLPPGAPKNEPPWGWENF